MDEDARDANGYKYSMYPSERAKLAQKVLNESWPNNPRDIHDQPAANQRACIVRLVLSIDGEVLLPGRAVRWDNLPPKYAHVFVRVDDPRVQRGMVWVKASDVRRA